MKTELKLLSKHSKLSLFTTIIRMWNGNKTTLRIPGGRYDQRNSHPWFGGKRPAYLPEIHRSV